MSLAGVLHRLTRVEAEARRRPPGPSEASHRMREVLPYATDEEARELGDLLRADPDRGTPGWGQAVLSGRAAELYRIWEQRLDDGEEPFVPPQRTFAGPVSAPSEPSVGDEIDYETRQRLGKLVEAHADGTSTLHIAPAVSVKLGFDATAKPDPSLFEDGPAAGSRSKVGLAAKAQAESIDAEPEPVVEPARPRRAEHRSRPPVERTPKWFDPPEGIEGQVF